jgi:flagellar protein FlbT
MLASFSDERILSSLKHVDRLVSEGEVFDALKIIRGLYATEAEILNLEGDAPAPLSRAVGA